MSQSKLNNSPIEARKGELSEHISSHEEKAKSSRLAGIIGSAFGAMFTGVAIKYGIEKESIPAGVSATYAVTMFSLGVLCFKEISVQSGTAETYRAASLHLENQVVLQEAANPNLQALRAYQEEVVGTSPKTSNMQEN